MIPVKLTLEGIYSYQKAQTIDFEKLTSARLFGIFGSVGSGKSAILEAMIYALYGDTGRMNRNDEVKYNMMNLKSDRLWIQFDFRAGEGKRLFRSEVEIKRNSKNFTDVRTPVRRFFVSDNNEWVPITETEVHDAIGLSSENFRRIVIIPQGKFQEFLHLDDKNRSVMLMELFRDLRQYDLQQKAGSLESQAKFELANLKGQFSGYENVTVEALSLLIDKKGAGETEKHKVSEQQSSLKLLLDSFKFMKEQFESLNHIREEITRLKLQEPKIKELEERIRQFEYCERTFKSDLILLADVRKTKKEVSDNLNKLNIELEAKNALMPQIEASLINIKKQYDNREALKRESEALMKMHQFVLTQVEVDTIHQRVIIGKEKIDELHLITNKVKEHFDQERNELTKLKEKMPDVSLLSTIKEWFIQNKQLITNRDANLALQKELSDRKQKFEEEFKQLCVMVNLKDSDTELSLQGLEKRIHTQKELFQKELTTLTERLQHLYVSQKLADFADNLHADKACPLCGSTDHPTPLRIEGVSLEIEQILKNQSSIKTQQDNAEALLRKVAALKEREAELLTRCYNGNTEAKKIQQAQQLHLSKFTWTAFSSDNETQLIEEIELVKQLALLIKEKDNLTTKLEADFKAKDSELDRYKKLLQDLQNKLAANEATAELLKEQLKEYDLSAYQNVDSAKFVGICAQLNEKYLKIENEYRQAESKYQQLKSVITQLEGSSKVLNSNLIDTDLKIESILTKIKELLKQSPFVSLDQISELLKTNLDLTSLRSQVTDYDKKIHTFQQSLQQLEAFAAEKTYDPVLHEAKITESTELDNKEKELTGLIATITQQLTRMESELKQKNAIENKMRKLELRVANLSLLRGLFTGSKFVKFVSSIYMQNLCNAANERFYKMTRQCLRLELNENNNFVVRDFINNGHLRSVKTLSGGQTFQAALCLALALTDNIKHLTGSSQNFFFLDEGFGALDNESLTIVFETLKSLRNENRIVGIISHVESLQQEIPTSLVVTNHEDGSQIKMI